jgi:hypothetical protein
LLFPKRSGPKTSASNSTTFCASVATSEARTCGISEHAIVARVATFATGTPIADSLGELWVIQTYLRPDLLHAAGVADLGD